MPIVGGLDIHRKQITFDYLDTVTGQVQRGQIAAVQNRFNLLDRSGVQVLADCEAQSIMFVPYFPLASGRLTSHDELTSPAERLGATPAQVALA